MEFGAKILRRNVMARELTAIALMTGIVNIDSIN